MISPRILLSFGAGFAVSFLLLLSVIAFGPILADLLSGALIADPARTIDIAAQTQSLQAATSAMASFWFWMGVGVIGSAVGFSILRMFRS